MRWAAENDFDSLLAPAAAWAGVELALVKALIGHESQFDPNAYHFDGPDPALNASYGLMQVEGTTARGYGYTGPVQGLYDPSRNITLGIRRLREALDRQGGDVARAVSDYNGGNRPSLGFGTPFPSGRFGNQPYVDAVLDNLSYFRAQTPAAPGDTTAAAAPAAAAPSALRKVVLVVAGILGAALVIVLGRRVLA
jgi:soluble lytic murein transglycosylase-like protein